VHLCHEAVKADCSLKEGEIGAKGTYMAVHTNMGSVPTSRAQPFRV